MGGLGLLLLGTTSVGLACTMLLPPLSDAPLAVVPAHRAHVPSAIRPGAAPPKAELVHQPPPARWSVPRCGPLPASAEKPAGLYFADRGVPGQVALTFDDGPLHGKTVRLLDVLRRHGARATFFVVGKMIHRQSFRVIQQLVSDGHQLANHTYHHDLAMARDAHPEKRIYAEFQLAQAMVDIALLADSAREFERLRRRLLGARAPRRFRSTLVERWPGIEARWRHILAEFGHAHPVRMRYGRPPGGNPFGRQFTPAQRRAYARAVTRAGLINVLWNFGTANDFRWLTPSERRNPERIGRSVLFAARRGGVLLIHDQIPPRGLARALEDLGRIPALRVVPLHRLVQNKYNCVP